MMGSGFTLIVGSQLFQKRVPETALAWSDFLVLQSIMQVYMEVNFKSGTNKYKYQKLSILKKIG